MLRNGMAVLICGLLYTAFFGCLCSMAGLSSVGIPALAPGALLPLALLAFRQKSALRIALPVTVILLSLAVLAFIPPVVNGWKVLLNRLFAASEARQSYIYDRFPVADPGVGNVKWAFLPLGLIAGCCLSQVFSRRPQFALLIFPPLFVLMAYLGVTPSDFWLIAAALVLPLPFLIPGRSAFSARRVFVIAAAVLLAGAVLIAFPGKHETLSAWEQNSRDRLALRSVYYGQQKPEEPDVPDPDDSERPMEQLEPKEEDENNGIPPKTAAILIFAILIVILLFVPAVLSDRNKKLRTGNRKGLNDPDGRVRAKAQFLYAVKWLRAAGLLLENKPFSAQKQEMLDADAGFGKEFSNVLPIWQEAAYSSHEITQDQLEKMTRFCGLAQSFAEKSMNRRQRLRAKYVLAL